MKKHVLTIAIVAATIALSACSKKSTPDPTTIAATEAESVAASVTDNSTEETTDVAADEIDLDYAAGEIVELEGNQLTIMDEFEEEERTFDISNANIVRTFPLTVGDYVEITFAEGTEDEVTNAIEVEVLDSVLAESEDPIMIGTIVESAADTLTLETEDGETFEFTTGNAYKVTGGGLEPGVEVQITYLGTPEEDEILMAVKIVTEDAYDTEAAAINAFIGEVDTASEHSVVLVSESGDYFTFTSDELDFSSFQEGDTLQVTYEGSISAKEIPATAVEKL